MCHDVPDGSARGKPQKQVGSLDVAEASTKQQVLHCLRPSWFGEGLLPLTVDGFARHAVHGKYVPCTV